MPSYDKPNHSPYFHGPLYQKMAEDLQLTGKAQRTVHGYLLPSANWPTIAESRPTRLPKRNSDATFSICRTSGSLLTVVSASRCRGSSSSFRPPVPATGMCSMLRLKNVKTLPEVITRQQVRQIILAATTLRMRIFFWTVYSMGLRLNEALHLQVGDIDVPASWCTSIAAREPKTAMFPSASSPSTHSAATGRRIAPAVSLSGRRTQSHVEARHGQHCPDADEHDRAANGHQEDHSPARLWQESHGAHFAPQFCHSSAGSRRQPARHSAVPWSLLADDHHRVSALDRHGPSRCPRDSRSLFRWDLDSQQ